MANRSHGGSGSPSKSIFSTREKKIAGTTALIMSGVLVAGMVPYMALMQPAKAGEVQEVPSTNVSDEPETVEGEYLVAYKDDIKDIGEDICIVKRDENASVLPSLASVETTTMDELGVAVQDVVSDREDNAVTKIVLDEGADADEVVKTLESSPDIDYVEPNYLYHLYSADADVRPSTITDDDRPSNDPYSTTEISEWMPNQYYIYNTHIADIWKQGVYCAGGNDYAVSSVQIAVIDSFPRIDHEDLVNQFDLTHARDFTDGTKEGKEFDVSDMTWDDGGAFTMHGTYVSGVLGAQANNEKGIAGTSYNAEIIPLAVTNGREASFSSSRLVAALEYLNGLIDSGDLPNLRVVNMSLGGLGQSTPLKTVIDDLYSKNVLVVAAAGNEGDERENYPACYENVLGVMGTNDTNYSKSSFSAYNEKIDVSAPSVSISSTIPWHSQGNWDTVEMSRYTCNLRGTSFSTPIVSGLAASLFASSIPQKFEYPEDWGMPSEPSDETGYNGVSADQVRKAIVQGAIDISNVDEKCEPFIDADRALFLLSNNLVDATDVAYPDNLMTETEKANFESHTHQTDDAHTTTIAEATCTDRGQVQKTCTYPNCDYKWIEYSPALGHQWKVNSETQPTCTTAGHIDHTCERCGVTTVEETDPLGHEYDLAWDWSEGYASCNVQVTCTRSGCDYQEIIPATVTSSVQGNNTVFTGTVSVGGMTYTDKRSQEGVHEHTAGATEITKQPTCTQAGEKLIHCSGCDVTWTEAIPAIGHKWVVQTNTEATCTTAGTKSEKCANPGCGETRSETIPALGHNWTVKWAWNNANEATASFSCANNHAHDTSIKGAMTQTEDANTITYKATVTHDGNTYSDTKTVNKSTGEPTDPDNPDNPDDPVMNPGETLKGGTYLIVSALNSNKLIDIAAASSANKANAQLWSNNDTDAQVFTVSYKTATKTYVIKNVNSKKVLAVDGSARNAANVYQTIEGTSKAQQWNIIKNSDGTYRIASALNNSFVLDVSAANTANGANIQIWQNNGTNAQKWAFKPTVSNAISGKTVANGTYEIVSKISSSKRIDISAAAMHDGANAQLWTSNGTSAQKFVFTYDGKGFYTIKNKKSNKMIDVSGGSFLIGANVWQYGNNGTDAQKWRVRKNSDGSFTITNKASGMALDVSGGVNMNGANIQQWTVNGTNAQKWTLKRTS